MTTNPLVDDDLPILEEFILEGGNVVLSRSDGLIVVKMSIKAGVYSISARGANRIFGRALREALDVFAEKVEKILAKDGGRQALDRKMGTTVRSILAVYDL